MCGLHGILTTKKRINTADDFIKNAFVTGTLRGEDASGIASIDTSKAAASIQKLAVPGTIFETNGYARSLMVRACSPHTLTICHTRAGTTGDASMESAHPFLIEDEGKTRQIIGVHNGTLTGWHNKPAAKWCTVDSEWAFTHIFNKGAAAFKDFLGAYVFIWWDSNEPKVLNIALNKERPINVAMLDDDGMAWASEPGMLAWLLERNRIKTVGKIKQLQPDHHYKFSLTDPLKFTKELLQKPPVIAATGSTRSATVVTGGYSTFEKVDAFLKQVRGDTAPANVIPLAGSDGRAVLVKASLTREEMENAEKVKVKNLEGVFQPIYEDEERGIILGEFLSVNDGTFNAEIRNCTGLMWTPKSVWYVKAIGAYDIHDKDGPTIICSKPEVNKIAATVN